MARLAEVVYAMSAVDKAGRVADRNVVQALGWPPRTRVDVGVRKGLIVVASAADGLGRLDGDGRLILPLVVRRRCGLVAGARLLLAADVSRAVLTGYPAAVLDRLLGVGASDGGESA